MAAADHQDTFIVLQRKMQDMILRLARFYRVACYRCLPRQLADAAIVPLSAGDHKLGGMQQPRVCRVRGDHSSTISPLFPPRLRTRRTASMRIERSTALHIS